MGLFKRRNAEKTAKNMMSDMAKSMYPKGDKDIEAGTSELLSILNNSIDKATAKSIFLKSSAISRIASNFDKERLQLHLAGYCLEHFNEIQLEKYYSYLIALSKACSIKGVGPSDVRRDADTYVW